MRAIESTNSCRLIVLGAYFRSSLLAELSGMIEVLERDVSVFFGWEIVDL